MKRNNGVLSCLSDHGAEVDVKDENGFTLLHLGKGKICPLAPFLIMIYLYFNLVVRAKAYEAARIFCDKSKNLNEKTNKGLTAMHIGILKKYY